MDSTFENLEKKLFGKQMVESSEEINFLKLNSNCSFMKNRMKKAGAKSPKIKRKRHDFPFGVFIVEITDISKEEKKLTVI